MNLKNTPRPRIYLRHKLMVRIVAIASVGTLVAIIAFFVLNTSSPKESKAIPYPMAGFEYIISLNGVNSDVLVNNVNLSISDSLTVACMLRWDTIPGKGRSGAYLMTYNSPSNANNGQFWLYHNSTNSKFGFAVNTSSGLKSIYGTTIPKKGMWYHLAGTYDGRVMKLYVNGVLEAQSNKSGSIVPNSMANNFKFIIGASAQSSYNYRRFKGSICRACVYDKALSYDDIQLLKCGGTSGVTSCTPIADFGVNYPDSTALFDRSGNGNVVSLNYVSIRQIPTINCNTLPVTITEFSAKTIENGVNVRWVTESEVNNDYFLIEKSVDGITYYNIGSVQGKGNSNSKTEYVFFDNEGISEVTYYRMQQFDFDGTRTQYGPVSTAPNEKTGIFTVHPNPLRVGQSLVIEGLSGDEKILFTDLSGRVFKQSNQLQEGTYILTIDNKFVAKIMVTP